MADEKIEKFDVAICNSTTQDGGNTAYDRCSCGRLMSLVCGFNSNLPDGVQVLWCAGCGVVTIHYNDSSGDSVYTPRRELIGQP